MVPFSVSLIFDLAVAMILIASVARVLRRHTSPELLSFVFYLVSWYALVLYMLIFLFATRFLPAGAQRGYLLFNSIFIVPLNGFVACFFADFIWRWLQKPMPRWLRFGLPIPFIVVLGMALRVVIMLLFAIFAIWLLGKLIILIWESLKPKDQA